MRAGIQGVSSCIRSFDYLFGVIKGEMLLPQSDNLSRILQSPKISAAESTRHQFQNLPCKLNLVATFDCMTCLRNHINKVHSITFEVIRGSHSITL